MTERSGVEIDYCQQCRGVWLDRGELDKIIERAATYEQQTAAPSAPAAPAGPAGPAAPPQPPPPSAAPYDPTPGASPYGQPQGYPPPPPPGYGHKDDSDYKFRYPGGGHYPRKRKSFLGEMFDFD